MLIETFRPGVADRLGLGYETLAAAQPRARVHVDHRVRAPGPVGAPQGVRGRRGLVLGRVRARSRAMSPRRPPALRHGAVVLVRGVARAPCRGSSRPCSSAKRSGQGQWVETNLAQALTIHEGASSAWYRYLVSHALARRLRRHAARREGGAPMHHFVYRLLVGQTKRRPLAAVRAEPPAPLRGVHARARPRVDAHRSEVEGHPDPRGRGARVELLQTDAGGCAGPDPRRVAGRVRPRPRRLRRAVPQTGPRCSTTRSSSTTAPSSTIDDPERGPVRQPGPQFRMTATPAALRGPARPRWTTPPDVGWADRPAVPASPAQVGGPARRSTA